MAPTPVALPEPLSDEDTKDLSALIPAHWTFPTDGDTLAQSPSTEISSRTSEPSTMPMPLWNTPVSSSTTLSTMWIQSASSTTAIISIPSIPPTSFVSEGSSESTKDATPKSSTEPGTLLTSPVSSSTTVPSIEETPVYLLGSPLPPHTLTWTPYQPNPTSVIPYLSPSATVLHTNQDFFKYMIIISVGGSALAFLMVLTYCGCVSAKQRKSSGKEGSEKRRVLIIEKGKVKKDGKDGKKGDKDKDKEKKKKSKCCTKKGCSECEACGSDSEQDDECGCRSCRRGARRRNKKGKAPVMISVQQA